MFAGSFAEGANHLWRGTAPDGTWLGVAELGAVPVTAVAVGPGVSPRVWAGERGGGVYASEDGGATFRFSGLTDHSVTALAPITDTVLAAASNAARRGVYGWDPATSQWRLRGGDQIASPIMYAIARDEGGRLWLATEARGLWRSEDDGYNWSAVSLSGSTSSTVISIEADPSDPLRVYAGHGRARAGIPSAADQTGIDVSQNGGVSWDPALRDLRDVTGLAALSSHPGAVYASGWGRGLFASFDGGRTWQSAPGPSASAGNATSSHLLSLGAVRPRGAGSCELLLAGASDGLWARNVARVRYHTVYLPSTACQSAHCTANALTSGQAANESLPRPDVADR
jgi:photosystem II stability/assembly factor-like uncharacterized protein